MFVKQIRRTQETTRSKRGEHFSRALVDVRAGAFIQKTQQRTEHILHMFCEDTVINIGHVARQWRGTAFSRRWPAPDGTLACSRALPLASDAAAFLLPVVTEHTQFCVAGIVINLFSDTPPCLVIPTMRTKTTFVHLARKSPRGSYVRADLDFARCFF